MNESLFLGNLSMATVVTAGLVQDFDHGRTYQEQRL